MTTAAPLILPENSHAGGALLHLAHWPAPNPRAVVLLAHGYAEHAGRYAGVAAALNAAGFAVYALDHWGHGRSEGAPGFIPRFSVYLDGMAALLERVNADLPAVPKLLLGHSMGGLIATLHLFDHQSAYAAAALSGPAIQPAAPPGRVMIWISRLLSRLAPRLGVLALDANGVSRDPAVVAAYKSDPLVYHGKISARLAEQLFDAMAAAQAGAPAITLPLLVQHGDADTLAAPAGGRFIHDHVGSAVKQMMLYPGLFHEIYNEPEAASVLADLVQFFDAALAGKKEVQ